MAIPDVLPALSPSKRSPTPSQCVHAGRKPSTTHKQRVADTGAKSVGIDQAFGDLLPED